MLVLLHFDNAGGRLEHGPGNESIPVCEWDMCFIDVFDLRCISED